MSVLALSDNSVWLDGLVVFYPIFGYLERHVPASVLPVEYHRAAAFEADIEYYAEFLGLDWRDKCKECRKTVVAYLQHLENVRISNPTLLSAYVYHLYMGLLSGGQILQKKRQLFNKFNPLSSGKNDGYLVTHFEGHTIADLKTRMRTLVDEAATQMDAATKDQMIEHSRLLFGFNNTIIQSVQGVQKAGLKKLGITTIVILSVWFCYQLMKKLY